MNKVIKTTNLQEPTTESLSELRRLNVKINDSPMLENNLAHYGVKGMRWGIRKERYTSNRAARRERGTAYKERRYMSEARLKSMVQRLETEKKLKSLIESDLAPGKVAVSDMLKRFGSSALGTVAGVLAAALVKEYLKKKGISIKGD